MFVYIFCKYNYINIYLNYFILFFIIIYLHYNIQI